MSIYYRSGRDAEDMYIFALENALKEVYKALYEGDGVYDSYAKARSLLEIVNKTLELELGEDGE